VRSGKRVLLNQNNHILTEKVARKREAVKKKEDIAIIKEEMTDAEKLYKRGVALALKKKMGDIGRG
jgi:hypothetical protein